MLAGVAIAVSVACVPDVVVIRPAAVTDCPSGLVTVTFFAPAVEPTVDTLMVRCVESVYVTLLTMTPGINATMRLANPAPGS